jgi:DNA-binding MarR family transcriptional regulator
VLAARLGLEPATISVAIGKLETAGHVERTTDPDDARARRVKLKKKGAGLGHVLRILEELESTALAGISDKDLATARRVLNRISENLNQPSSQGATS